jgi:phosphoribosylamine--glycine ligase
MNILLIGSGGREHALAWKLRQSIHTDNLFVAPGNAGTAKIASNISLDINNPELVKNFVENNNIEMIVVGPETPLANGLKDKLQDILHNVHFIGPSAHGAKLESSKSFAKKFMQKNNIPTAAHIDVTQENIKEGYDFIDKQKAPYVLKADGLAAGKGVIITESKAEAYTTLDEMLKGKFGTASHKVVIEEFLEGIEVSVFVLTDGKNYVLLPEAKDYKRIYDGDKGPNTGGMGNISPVPFADKEFMGKVEEQIIKPTIKGLNSDNIDYKGFIFFGLMNVKGNPYVIEYNVRLGDPEAQTILPLVENDFVELLVATSEERLDTVSLIKSNKTAATVILASRGYPNKYKTGKIITGLDEINDSIIFHAGTKLDENGNIITSGGRVLAITSLGKNIKEALSKSYKSAEIIKFEGKYYRKDIGQDLLKIMQEY